MLFDISCKPLPFFLSPGNLSTRNHDAKGLVGTLSDALDSYRKPNRQRDSSLPNGK